MDNRELFLTAKISQSTLLYMYIPGIITASLKGCRGKFALPTLPLLWTPLELIHVYNKTWHPKLLIVCLCLCVCLCLACTVCVGGGVTHSV